MDTWKIQLVVVTFFEINCFFFWQSESLDMRLNNPMEDLMKRSKALRFYGLMGKRSGRSKPFQFNRRNKGEMFVGLMGRSISSGVLKGRKRNIFLNLYS
uniref:Uncharacterized protein n=1 Tax=Oryzias latipes TaxID=8090 RepID=A0A3B3HTN7_ORYLA